MTNEYNALCRKIHQLQTEQDNRLHKYGHLPQLSPAEYRNAENTILALVRMRRDMDKAYD